MSGVARRIALVLGLLGVGSVARAETPVPIVPADAPTPVVRASSDDVASPSSMQLGLSLMAGVPAGATAEVVFAPIHFLRLEGGAAFNGIAPGILGGVTLVPFHAVVTPVLALQVGHMFEGDAGAQISSFVALSEAEAAVAKRIGYDFASAELGLEVGAPDSFVFTLRAGLSGVQGTIHTGAALSGVPSSALTISDMDVRAVVPSARLGFLVFF